MIQAGGPLQMNRTRRGREQMEIAACQLPDLPPPESLPTLTIHLLTGKNFWYQTAFCLHSLATAAKRTISAQIYDDGSLRPTQQNQLRRLFPAASFIRREATEEKLDRLLPRAVFPTLRNRWDEYPNIRKLIDPHLGSHGWKLVIDSDLLFFRDPRFLLDWIDRPTQPLHAVDVENAYGYSDSLLASLTAAPLARQLNVGLCGLRSEDLDWTKLEALCHTLITTEGTNYYLEQALVAVLLAGRPCAVAPAEDYLTLPVPPEASACRAVMHHYVAGSKRWYFQNNWKRFTAPPPP